MNPDAYERMVRDIINDLSSEVEPYLERFDLVQDVRLKGRSGHEHQIDVLIDFRAMGLDFRVIVECKYWNKSVGVEQVMVVDQRKEDLSAQKAVIVTKHGFQKGALTVAEDRNIALVICRQNPVRPRSSPQDPRPRTASGPRGRRRRSAPGPLRAPSPSP